MKKSFFSICLLLIGTIAVVAQGQDNSERQDRRTRYITKKLDLTSDQATALVPVLEAMGDEIRSAHENLNLREDRGDLESITDAEASERMEKLFTLERQKLDIKKKYSSQIKSVIGPKKTLRFFHIFSEFESQRRGKRGDKRGKKSERKERKREMKQQKRLERQ